MIVLPIVALIVGAVIGILVHQPVRGEAGLYLAVACLAGLDTVCGGLRGGLEGKFRNDVFISGFFVNTSIAFALAWLGDRIGVNIFLVCAFIFGQRIFNNLSLIRRSWLSLREDARASRMLEAQAASQSSSASPTAKASQ